MFNAALYNRQMYNQSGNKFFGEIAIIGEGFIVSSGNKIISSSSTMTGIALLESVPTQVIRSIYIRMKGSFKTNIFGIRQQPSSILAKAISDLTSESNTKLVGTIEMNNNSLLKSEQFKKGFTLANLISQSDTHAKNVIKAVSSVFLVGKGNSITVPIKALLMDFHLIGEGQLESYPVIIAISSKRLIGRGYMTTAEPYIHRWFYEDIEEVEWITKNTPQTVWNEVKDSPTVWKKVIK